MTTLKIITNNSPRPLLGWWELTPKEKKKFDWIDDPDSEGLSFFRYKGIVYSLDEFMQLSHPDLKNWDGYASDTYFSGILVKFYEYGESIIVGRFYS